MRAPDSNREWKKQPITLTDEERADPMLVFREFRSSFHLPEVRETLWEWFTIAITTENDTYDDAASRSNLLFFYEKLEKLLEAIYVHAEDQSDE